MGVPATGRAIEVSGVDMFRLENGRIVESWVLADALSALIQRGLVSPPGGPA